MDTEFSAGKHILVKKRVILKIFTHAHLIIEAKLKASKEREEYSEIDKLIKENAEIEEIEEI